MCTQRHPEDLLPRAMERTHSVRGVPLILSPKVPPYSEEKETSYSQKTPTSGQLVRTHGLSANVQQVQGYHSAKSIYQCTTPSFTKKTKATGAASVQQRQGNHSAKSNF